MFRVKNKNPKNTNQHSSTTAMIENNHRESDYIQKPDPDFDTGLGWEFLTESWHSRWLIMSFAVVGLSVGSVFSYFLPKSYTAKLEIKAGPIEKYDNVFSAFIVQNKPGDVLDNFIRPEIKIVNDAISEAVYNPNLFSSLIQKSKQEYLKNEFGVNDIVKFKKMSPERSLEKYFIPGYSVEISLGDRTELVQLTKIYIEEVKKHINVSTLTVLKDILKSKLNISNLNFEIAKKKYDVDIENSIEYIQESIDLARAGGFAKPVMPTQMPVTAQIPLQTAVPRYFFGYEVLEQEKKQIALNADDETKIPGYSDYIAERSRLVALSDFLDQADMNFVDVSVFPKIEGKNGLMTKLALVVASTLLLMMASLLIVAFRIFQCKIERQAPAS